MAKIRAYKLAEELEIERDEFVEKVRSMGIELRGPMAGLDDEQAADVRAKLGAGAKVERIEKRTASGTVIRRRRKVVEPEPTAAPEPVAVAEPELAPAAAEPESPAEVVEPEPQIPEPVAAKAPESQPAARPEAPAAPPSGRRAPAPSAETAPSTEAPGRDAAARRAQPVRRAQAEQIKLKEQEALGRTMLGNVQHRLELRRSIVEQQSRDQRRRRGPKKLPLRPAGPRKKIIRVTGDTSFKELAAQTGVKVRDLVRRARNLGAELERDDLVDLETLNLLAEDIGYEVQLTSHDVEEGVAATEVAEEDLEPRPPVVTVMGHVDHGKTSLLDTLRQTNVVEGEAGGITQHIGAYKVSIGGAEIAFLDTPGHAAFTQMRARGAQATDVVVLVVAANDGVMPQTVEAINHARAAGVPIIVAINKIDLPDADPQRTKQALLEHELVPEDFGGDVICVEISATKGTGIEKLLEMLALQTEILELKARRDGPARGVVVEAQLDKGRGPVATVLVREGTLKPGDALVAGQVAGRVRTLINEHGQTLKDAPPSTPVQIVGLSGVPEAGQDFVVLATEREAKAIAEHRQAEERREAMASVEGPDMEDAFGLVGGSDLKELALVMKADVRGTMEAIRETAEKISTERVQLNVIHSGVGAITESDIMLAIASKARVMGFHVRPEAAARKLAEREGIEIRTFDVVYELLDDVTALMTGLLPPKTNEVVSGHAEVRQLFVIPRRGTVAGCAVVDGVMKRSDQVRVVRNGVPVYSGGMDSLRHVKDDVREVRSPMECGIRVANYNDYKVGDVLEAFHIEETPDTL